eukprot:714774-Pyramimonas_sp.AAC.1
MSHRVQPTATTRAACAVHSAQRTAFSAAAPGPPPSDTQRQGTTPMFKQASWSQSLVGEGTDEDIGEYVIYMKKAMTQL